MHDVYVDKLTPLLTCTVYIQDTRQHPRPTTINLCLAVLIHDTGLEMQAQHEGIDPPYTLGALGGNQSLRVKSSRRPRTPNPQRCTSLNDEKETPRRNRPHSFQEPRFLLLKQTAHDPPSADSSILHHNSPLTIQDSISQQLLRASRVR